MARPKLKEPKQQYTVMLEPSVVKEIDKLAGKIEISRSQMMANLIDMALDDAKILDESGALWVMNSGKKALKYLKRQFLNGKEGETEQG
jgi:hypothetical protein